LLEQVCSFLESPIPAIINSCLNSITSIVARVGNSNQTTKEQLLVIQVKFAEESDGRINEG
jgi:hypothetical protein